MPTSSTMPKPADATEQAPVAVTTLSLLFQLEDVAVNGRGTAFKALKDRLGKMKLSLDESVFRRICLGTAPQVYVPAVLQELGAEGVDAASFTQEVVRDVAERLASDDQPIKPAFLKLLRDVRAKEFGVGVITALPEATAQVLVCLLGAETDGLRLVPLKDVGPHFPASDAWLKAAKAMGLLSRRCGALARSAAACKSALAADMRCVVVPDEFTDFQDFSGASLVLESLDELSAKEILEALFPFRPTK